MNEWKMEIRYRFYRLNLTAFYAAGDILAWNSGFIDINIGYRVRKKISQLFLLHYYNFKSCVLFSSSVVCGPYSGLSLSLSSLSLSVKGWRKCRDSLSYRSCKAPVKYYHQQTNTAELWWDIALFIRG